MNLTANSYKFNPVALARETADAYSADSFNSWPAVARVLATRGFNRYEAEAILRSKLTRWCRDCFAKTFPASSTTLGKYLDKNNITPGCTEVNGLVMSTFSDELKLELDESGRPCTRGTMPGNYHPNKTILVPLGTPDSCNPQTETYWSM
jgi:hypothetical protein